MCSRSRGNNQTETVGHIFAYENKGSPILPDLLPFAYSNNQIAQSRCGQQLQRGEWFKLLQPATANLSHNSASPVLFSKHFHPLPTSFPYQRRETCVRTNCTSLCLPYQRSDWNQHSTAFCRSTTPVRWAERPQKIAMWLPKWPTWTDTSCTLLARYCEGDRHDEAAGRRYQRHCLHWLSSTTTKEGSTQLLLTGWLFLCDAYHSGGPGHHRLPQSHLIWSRCYRAKNQVGSFQSARAVRNLPREILAEPDSFIVSDFTHKSVTSI